MFGDISISFPVYTNGHKPIGKPFQFFGKNGKMLNPKTGDNQNTTISAIGTLKVIKPNAIVSGFNSKLEQYANAIKDVHNDDEIKLYEKRGKLLADKLTKKGYDLELQQPFIEFFINPFARINFPIHNFNKRIGNSIYKYIPESGEIEKLYDYTEKLSKL